MTSIDTGTTIPDPRVLVAQGPLRARQVLAISLCVALNALDGFDVLSISFASPGIAAEWHVSRAALGLVLSMELIGMAVGSLIVGQMADRFGRRLITLVCLAVMASGMLATTRAGEIDMLALMRLATGLGIGGMLATTNALVAEYANNRWRGAAVAIMASGYPMGGIVGGAIASHLLAAGGWRDVFLLGAGMTAVLLPMVVLALPEPVAALMLRRRGDSLAQVNRSLRALGHEPVGALPPPEPAVDRTAIATLFAPGLRPVTLLLTMAYFFHIITFYFILKWVPKIVVDQGFLAASAGTVLVWANVGGVIGGLLLSGASLRFGLRQLLVAAMFASSAMVTVFGIVAHSGHVGIAALSWAAAAGGFCTNAGVVGLYALVASSFPTAVRAGGTGFVIGIGRGGAALGPILAGLLFQLGLALPWIAAIMGCGSLLAAMALLAMPGPVGETGDSRASGCPGAS